MQSREIGRDDFDVIIIGGSLAGATLAHSLGRKGRRVLVVERGSFPRRKACGEGLSALGSSALARLGLSAELESAAGLPFCGYEIWHGERRTDVVHHSGAVEGVGVERLRLDAALVEACAKHPSVLVQTAAEAADVTLTETGVVVTLGGERIRGSFLAICDGRDSTTACRLGIPEELRGAERYGIALPFRGKFDKVPDRVHVVLGDTFQAFLTPVSCSLLNVSMLGSPGGTNLRKVAESPAFAAMLESLAGFRGAPDGQLLGKRNLQHGRRPSVYRRALLLGDAAEHLDPIGGMGMTHAILCAELAGHCLEEVLCGLVAPQTALLRYSRDRERLVRPLRGFTGLTYSALQTLRKHPRFMSPAMEHFGHRLSRAVRSSPGEAMLNSSVAHLSLSLIGALL